MSKDQARIFISHAWEDKPLVRELEALLRDAGVEVWVDHSGIRGGDNLPKRINDALAWCNTLLLIWSQAASESHWVELEWSNAISLRKAIIPCWLGEVSLPPILAHLAYLNFRDHEQGIEQLLQALQLVRKPQKKAAPAVTKKVAQVIHGQLQQETPSGSAKPPQFVLRSQPIEKLDEETVKQMLRERNFFASNLHKEGKGIAHQYERRADGQVVHDGTTGLNWQQSGSQESITYAKAQEYVNELNRQRFAGRSDWRLPTLEEAMSLMEPKEHGDLYLDPMFDRKQTWIWTADKHPAGSVWVVHFFDGVCTTVFVFNYVRAVF